MGLEQFLFADCGYEFFEVEWLEVGDVLESAGSVGCKGWFEHSGGLRHALAEVSVRVLDDVCAFAGSVADEEAWPLLQVFGEAVLVDDGWGSFGDLFIGGRFLDFARNDRGEDGGVDLHAAGVDHWDDEAGRSLDFARDDRRDARDDRRGLSDECVKSAYGKKWLA